MDFIVGDIFDDGAEALVNTVNTVGVMGKGIALQFKRRFPANFKAYKSACDNGAVVPGTMFVWRSDELVGPKWIINFPTKRHWRAKSRIEDIEAGLRDLRRVIQDLGIASVAVPPLGCGNGGLRWRDVRPLIEKNLQGLDDVHVIVHEPAGAPAPTQMAPNPRTPRMTAHRAAMLLAFETYLRPGYTLGRLEAQKLLYLLQVSGAPYERLNFVRGQYGPYADGIRHVLNQVEGHFIRGYGDGDTNSAIELIDAGVRQARSLIQKPDNSDFRSALASLEDLIEGFDDAFGLELLASVHWLATVADPPASNSAQALRMLGEWSDRKERRYDEHHVRAAWNRLAELKLVSGPEPPPAPHESTESVVVLDDDLAA